MRRRPTSGGASIAVLAFVLMLSMPGHEASAQVFSSRGGTQGAPWTKVPSVVVAQATDSQVAKVRDAVAFWNHELAAIGTPFRLGSVRQSRSEESNLSERDQFRPGEIVVVFNLGGGISHARRPPGSQTARVVMRREESAVVAHELGHAIGLRHNSEQGSLMHAGRPQSRVLTAGDKASLLAMYPGHRTRQ